MERRVLTTMDESPLHLHPLRETPSSSLLTPGTSREGPSVTSPNHHQPLLIQFKAQPQRKPYPPALSLLGFDFDVKLGKSLPETAHWKLKRAILPSLFLGLSQLEEVSAAKLHVCKFCDARDWVVFRLHID